MLIALESGAVAEPLPAGVWIRPAMEAPAVAVYRRWLRSSSAVRPGEPGGYRVVVGYPESPPLYPGAITEYCEVIPAAAWPEVRFSLFGPVHRPGPPHSDKDAFGQVLADLLNRFVIVGTGIRVCTTLTGGGREQVLLPVGAMSWLPYTMDFGFAPRVLAPASPGRAPGYPMATGPVPMDAAAPIAGLVQTGPGVFALEDDVVLEVVQSGLWVRPRETPADSAAVRGAQAEPLRANLIYDTSSGAAAGRMRALGADVLQRLAAGARTAFRLLPAHALSRGRIEVETSWSAAPDAEPAAAETVVLQGPLPPAIAEPAVAARDEPPRARAGESASSDGAVLTSAAPAASPDGAPDEPAASEPACGDPLPEPLAQPHRSPLIRLESGLPSPPPERPTPSAAGPGSDGRSPGTLPDTCPEPGESASPGRPAGAGDPARTGEAAEAPRPVVPRATAARSAGPVGASPDSPRAQSTPDKAACALPPGHGLDEERDWLRRSLADRYDAEAGSISRLLSEIPGLRGGTGETEEQVVTDLVAARLYLAGDTRALDDAVRAGTVGPHIPMARCVASGLRRLPSYRGATRLRADLSPDELRWYAGRRTVTEWSFCPAMAGGHGRLPGATEVLIWSVTARRTALLVPDLPEQVVFLPGTRFSVLPTEAAGHSGLLMRERAATEQDASDAPSAFDERAQRGLESVAKAWREAAGAQRPLPPAADGRFGNPPGLILARRAPATTRVPVRHHAVAAAESGHSWKGPTA